MRSHTQTKAAPTEFFSPLSTGILQRKCASCGQHTIAGGECTECGKKNQFLQRRSASQAETPEVPPIVYDVLRSPGQPLDAGTRTFMESRFGHDFSHVQIHTTLPQEPQTKLTVGSSRDIHEQEAEQVADAVLQVRTPQASNTGPGIGYDFSQVRVHTDAKAADSARAVNALAYTVGRDIVFGAGQYAPSSKEGQRLLAHELTHTIQQQNSQSLQRKSDDSKCSKVYVSARNFKDLVDLVREAEKKLIACGITDVEERIHILRGIYYGTKWSADYTAEASEVRNKAFQIYTASSEPEDPRACLNCGLFEALQKSQDVTDPKRHVDFGHLIIGMDARRSKIARSVKIPTQGGTGLAISTWLGDLGGGAAMLAHRRVTAPKTPAVNVFSGTDFGGSINLEGDIAGYVVARDKTVTDKPSAPNVPSGKMIADVLEDYLSPAGAGAEWNSRCVSFLQIVGGTLDTSGALTNRTALIDDLAHQIEQFACWYLVNRLRQTGKLNVTTLRTASTHIVGASKEVSEVFVDALEYCQKHPGDKLSAHGSSPTPSAPGSISSVCQSAISAIETAEKARGFVENIEKKGKGVIEDVKKRWNDFF